MIRMSTVRPIALVAGLMLATTSLGAQSSVAFPFGVHLGVPQGEFAQNVDAAIGIGGGVLWKVGGPFALRADLGVMIYGSETRRVPLGGGALGLITVDVTTTNTIFGGSIGGQLGVPSRTVMPYVGGAIGFSAFTTTSSVEGSNSNNIIDLSNATNFAATGGYDMNGAGGNDILIGSGGADWIGGGIGADTMTGGAGIEYFQFEQGDSPAGVVNLSAGGTAGVLGNGDTFTFAGGVDRITDFSSNEGFNLNALHQEFSGIQGPGWMGTWNETPANSVQPSNGLTTDQGFFLTQGNYSGTTFTVSSIGFDTLVVYDGDSTAGVTQTGIVLSGVTLAQLNAYSGNNWISHI